MNLPGQVEAGHFLPSPEKAPDGKWVARWHLTNCSDPARDAEADAFIRAARRGALEGDAKKAETVEDAFVAALRNDDPVIQWSNEADLEDLAARFARWRAPLAVPTEECALLRFTLVTHAEKPLIRVSSLPKSRAGLTAFGQAIRLFRPLAELAPAEGGIYETSLSPEEAHLFATQAAPLLQAAGFATEIPPDLLGDHITATAEITDVGRGGRPRPPAPTFKGKLRIHVDGEEVSEAEIRFLLDQGTPFVFFRDRWIEVDRIVLRNALRALEENGACKLSRRQALAFVFGMGRAGRLPLTAGKATGSLRGLLLALTGEKRLTPLKPPRALKATLRDYQIRGMSWLVFLARNGFGALLADDMGLGKTIQTIAALLYLRAANTRARKKTPPVLIVCPLSVTTNWMRELKRFAPRLTCYQHQGTLRYGPIRFRKNYPDLDVVVTGYSTFLQDYDLFSSFRFSALVLDEAQIVKNPDTRLARAACAFESPVRIALTGTPMENRPEDVWSIEEFLNPGLLGARADFKRQSEARLKRVLEPFILRRLKTDPGIAAELGDKHDIREYCSLSVRQRRAYEEALAHYRDDVAEGKALGTGRRGRVLALLTELKLVCDGDGKYDRLIDLLSSIFDAGESALIFTQYAKVGAQIRTRLAQTFGTEFPFLNGALSLAQRDREIAAFNESPVPNCFILSLRAGGFGLNLTRATHVIHFDRWWNPAVESQATDRAYRIGQRADVFVHYFLTAGTLEDRIDAILAEKRTRAGRIITSGEAFLASLSDEELLQMTKLDA